MCILFFCVSDCVSVNVRGSVSVNVRVMNKELKEQNRVCNGRCYELVLTLVDPPLAGQSAGGVAENDHEALKRDPST